jgi:hypothetical protein
LEKLQKYVKSVSILPRLSISQTFSLHKLNLS